MNRDTKHILIIEVIAIVLSLLPPILLHFAPTLFGIAANDELTDFIFGLVVYIIYPALNLVISFICAWCGMKWYVAILSAPCAFVLVALIFWPMGILDVLFMSAIYAAVGTLAAWPVARYRRKKDADDRYLGKRL